MKKNNTVAVFVTSRERRIVNELGSIPQPSVPGMIMRATFALLFATAFGCSSEDGSGTQGGGGGAGASASDGGTPNGSGGMNSAGAGASGGPSRGGNVTGVGGATSGGGTSGGGTSGGSSGSGTGASTSTGGTNVGGATISGGRTGAGGGSSGAGGSAGACPGVGAACDPTSTYCCAGLVCVTSTSPDYAGCREDCTTAADCASGCCIPFGNLPDKGFCGAAIQCQCAADGETCGGTRQCCSGFSCSTFDGTGALACHKTCTQNADCSTNCCVTITGTPDKVCLPAKPWCGP